MDINVKGSDSSETSVHFCTLLILWPHINSYKFENLVPVKIFYSLQHMFQSIYGHRPMVSDVIGLIRDLGQFPRKRHST